MAHSNRNQLHWIYVVVEIALFIAASLCAYLSQVSAWTDFTAVSVAAAILFALVKITEAVPTLRELMVREDFASKIALSAGTYGVREYFNMQSAKDQALRNEMTQKEIQRAQHLWLCANSGASFLDPAIYRHWQFVERQLNAGTEFRIVLLDPYSGEKAFRNQINVSGEQLDSKVNVANLIKLHNTYPGLEIRFAKHGMHATVFATENCVFFDPYQVGVVGDRIENRSFALRIEPTQPAEGVGLYRLLKSHFETLWRTSTAFSEWIEEAKDKLPAGLPILKPR